MNQLKFIVKYDRIFICLNSGVHWEGQLDLVDCNISLLFDRCSCPVLNELLAFLLVSIETRGGTGSNAIVDSRGNVTSTPAVCSDIFELPPG